MGSRHPGALDTVHAAPRRLTALIPTKLTGPYDGRRCCVGVAAGEKLLSSGAMRLDLLVRDGLICREDAPPVRGTIGIQDGRVAVVAASAEGLSAREVIDAAGRLIMPGMIDPHIHIGHGAPDSHVPR